MVDAMRRLAEALRQEERNLRIDRDQYIAVMDAKIALIASVWARIDNELDRIERDAAGEKDAG